MATYKFITKSNQQDEQIQEENEMSFYQIATFPYPKTNLYHVRKFKINSENNITKMTEHNVKQKHYDLLLKQKKNNEYKLYSVYNLSTTAYPCKGDILLLKSNILSNNTNYSRYANF